MTGINKKLISLIALLLALLTVLSCTGTPPADITDSSTAGESSTAEITEAVPVLPNGILLAGPELDTVCAIVYPADSDTLRTAAEDLAEYIKAALKGTEIPVASDKDTPSAEYKINISSPDSSLSSEYSVKLEDKTVNLVGKDEANLLEAVSYFKLCSVTDGYLVIPESLSFSSNAGPKVLSQSPEKYYYYEDVYTPELIYSYDEKEVVIEKSKLIVGGEDVTGKAVWENGTVTLSNYTVEAGDHTVLLALADTDGDIEVFETTFSCGDGSVMNLYSGEVHAHTSDSDGQSTVEEAYAYARDVADLDFFSVTDHSNSFSNVVYQQSHIPNADRYNDPGNFVALYGYEQTYNLGTGFYGHLNTINYGSLTKREQPLRQYYLTMKQDPNAVVMFNHPGYKWGNFLEYGYYSESVDKVLCLSEIKGKSYDTEYALSLTKGWHVSPMYNEDNHQANWGNAYEYCGYALAPALTRENIIEAFHKNRTYTTTDKSLKIYYQINGEWMGSRLNNPDKLKVRVELSTEKDYGLGTVSLIGEDNITVGFITLGARKQYVWEFEIDPCYDYYYIKVEAGSGKTWCVTAPIWIENREHLSMNELSHALVVNNSTAADHRIFAELKNTTSEPLTDVEVKFYSSALTGFNELKQRALATVNLDSIAPGETVTVHGDVAYSISAPRIYAVATAKQGENTYSAVRYIELSNIYFSEIVSLTSNSDAYEYIELYNNSDKNFNLATVKMRYYPKAGAKTADLEANIWTLSGTIAPHSTMVLWVVSEGNKLTVADFNKHYGTNLVEGKDIIRVVGNNIPHKNPVQLELFTGSYVVARAWYNWAEDVDVHSNKSIVFDYPTDYTVTAKSPKIRVTPTPGSLADGQMPEIIN